MDDCSIASIFYFKFTLSSFGRFKQIKIKETFLSSRKNQTKWKNQRSWRI